MERREREREREKERERAKKEGVAWSLDRSRQLDLFPKRRGGA
jgi:hypothetical protein